MHQTECAKFRERQSKSRRDQISLLQVVLSKMVFSQLSLLRPSETNPASLDDPHPDARSPLDSFPTFWQNANGDRTAAISSARSFSIVSDYPDETASDAEGGEARKGLVEGVMRDKSGQCELSDSLDDADASGIRCYRTEADGGQQSRF